MFQLLRLKMATKDNLEQKIDLILENIELKKREQRLEEENKGLQERLDKLNRFVRRTSPVDDYKDLLEKFEKLLESTSKVVDVKEREKRIIGNIASVLLSPAEIDDFLNISRKFQVHDSYNTLIGYFITSLIQNSYDGGNNGFNLTTRGYREINYIGINLLAGEDNPARIVINGNAGNSCFLGASYVEVRVEGAVGDFFGYGAYSSYFYARQFSIPSLLIRGGISTKIGGISTKCTFSFDECISYVEKITEIAAGSRAGGIYDKRLYKHQLEAQAGPGTKFHIRKTISKE